MAPTFQIDSALAEFLVGPVAMVVATSNADHRPHTTRAYAASVSANGERVTVHVPTVQSEAVRADIDANGRIAVVFSRVRDYKTYQLKGDDAEVGQVVESPALGSYLDDFVNELNHVGLSPGATRGLAFGDYTALTFTPTSAFTQTPGPNAGKPIGGHDE
jgi:hypothetical protein